MKLRTLLLVLVLLSLGPNLFAGAWDPSDADADAKTTYRDHGVAFYWTGQPAAPLGVPLKYRRLTLRYPRLDAGMGDVVSDPKFRAERSKYVRRHNETMLWYALHKPKVPLN